MMRICRTICRVAPIRLNFTNGAISKNATGISIHKVAATDNRNKNGWSWCAYQAKGPGKHWVAK